MVGVLILLSFVGLSGALHLPKPRLTYLMKSSSSLQMSVYSSAQGVPAQIVEERDACGTVHRCLYLRFKLAILK